jgi:hypothetical protein
MAALVVKEIFVYDMYRWDQPEQVGDGGGGGGGRAVTSHQARPAVNGAGPAVNGARPAVNGARPARRGGTGGRGSGAQAVQMALDLRDNGGDSSAARDQ